MAGTKTALSWLYREQWRLTECSRLTSRSVSRPSVVFETARIEGSDDRPLQRGLPPVCRFDVGDSQALHTPLSDPRLKLRLKT